MMKKPDKLYAIRTEINQFVNKYNKLDKIPFDVGGGELLYPSEMNMIEAIGKGTGDTVTQLCVVFGVTKGAISQIISKLNARGYVGKVRNEEYPKEIVLSLTMKGREVYEKHERFHQNMDRSMAELMQSIPPERLAVFREILGLADKHLDTYLNLSRKEI